MASSASWKNTYVRPWVQCKFCVWVLYDEQVAAYQAYVVGSGGGDGGKA